MEYIPLFAEIVSSVEEFFAKILPCAIPTQNNGGKHSGGAEEKNQGNISLPEQGGEL